jgi:hypothetical protein
MHWACSNSRPRGHVGRNSIAISARRLLDRRDN